MDIRSPGEFARFLSANDFVKLDGTFAQLVNCVNNFSAACSCHKREDRMKLYGVCTRMYLDGASQAAPRFKTEFLSKTTDRQICFYTEQGQPITTICR